LAKQDGKLHTDLMPLRAQVECNCSKHRSIEISVCPSRCWQSSEKPILVAGGRKNCKITLMKKPTDSTAV